MLLAVATRERAECLGRHVGAILVREGRIIATGYNGTPRGFPRCNDEERGCMRCADRERYGSGSAYDVCICVHAEQNALLQAARLGYSADGAACYTTLQPCFGCLKELHQAGVTEIRFLNTWEPPAEPARSAYQAPDRRLSRPTACASCSWSCPSACSTCAAHEAPLRRDRARPGRDRRGRLARRRLADQRGRARHRGLDGQPGARAPGRRLTWSRRNDHLVLEPWL